MLTISKVNPEQAQSYFEKSKGEREEYYTKHMTSYDRWHGALAKSIGLKGEMTKEQFDTLANHLKETHPPRNPAFLDLTFSAAKSVSLLQADPRYHDDMIAAQQAAVAKMTDVIESDYLQVKVDGKMQDVHNAIFAGFLHELARPTKDKTAAPNSHENIPTYSTDPDLHIHLLLANMTIVNGKERAIDFSKLLGRNSRSVNKQLGLLYRQYLAKELQDRGYPLEVTDAKNGFYEVKGFSREVIQEYSSRREEILETAKEKGIADMQKANQLSRTAKDKSKKTPTEIFEEVKTALFDSGRVKIEKEETQNEREYEIDGSRAESRGEVSERRGGRGLQDFASTLDRPSAVERDFAEQAEPRVPDVQERGLDADEKRRQHESALLLSGRAVERLAECQAASVRRVYVRKARTEQRRERLKEIDRLTSEVIEDMVATDYAIALPTLKHRIRAAAVLLDLSDRDIEKAIDRAGLIEIGRKLDKNGKPSKDRYLAPKDIIDIEPRITQRVAESKNVITGAMDIKAARAALARVEDFDTQKAHGVKDGDLFKIENGEQGEAVCHVLTCRDRYLAIDGLAGTGKTTLMQRLKWISDENGIDIKGLCFTGKAAAGLEAESGIQSKTIHSFLNSLEKESGIKTEKDGDHIKQTWDFSRVKPATKREIWVVDEAGLVDMRLMNELQKAAEARNAQIVFSGDPKQLPPVGVGTPMQDMEAAGMATAYLKEIRRQRNASDDVKQAVRESVVGDTAEAVKLLEKRGDFREIKSNADRRAAVVSEMMKSPLDEYKKSLLLVSTNESRIAYNKAIRKEFVKRGELAEGNEYTITRKGKSGQDIEETRHFAQNDRIIFKKNDNRLHVKNGEMATIKEIQPDGRTFVAVKDSGEEVKFDIEQYNVIDHSYAVTSYAAQGMTVTKAVADMTTLNGARETRNSFYVNISRTKDTAIVFTSDKAKLASQIKDFAVKENGASFERVRDIQKRGVQNNDFYKSTKDAARDKLERALRDIEAQTQQLKEKPQQERPDVAKEREDADAAIRALVAMTEKNNVALEAPEPEREPFVMPEPPQRPQSAHEDERIRVDARPKTSNLSTSRGIDENREEKGRPESPVSPSERATQPSIPMETQEPPQREDIPPQPIFITASATIEEAEAAIQKNTEMRTELYNKTRAEVAPQFDLRNDPKYKDIQKRAAEANEKSYLAGKEAKKATKERGDKFQDWKRAEAEDRNHEGFFSSIGYKKQAPSAEAAFAKAQNAEDAANREYTRASEAAETANRDLHDYETNNKYAIERAVKKRAPRIAEYDEAIKRAKEHVRVRSRAAEREATYEHRR